MRGPGKKFTGAKARQRNCGLGDALKNATNKGKHVDPAQLSDRHTVDFLSQNNNMVSVVDDATDLLQVVARSHLEEREHDRENSLKMVQADGGEKDTQPTAEQQQFINETRGLLRVPRRPVWSHTMQPAEVQQNELAAFFKWREQLSVLEENRVVAMSPYEKNIEYWRQLWRVVEFADLVIQIVDARNPLLFYSRDLVTYVGEVAQQQNRRKQTFLVLNKADLVPAEARRRWARYFHERGVRHCFYSALREEEAIKRLLAAAPQDEAAAPPGPRRGAAGTRFEAELGRRGARRQQRLLAREEQRRRRARVETLVAAAPEPPAADGGAEGRVIGRRELVETILGFKGHAAGRFCAGTVGFPNIGKSSVINTLAVQTGVRAAVGETPGKTKHFQTIEMPGFTLCDCPGLVFPCFSHCRADFVLNGVLPVDKERDYAAYLRLACSRIPARVFNRVYALQLREDCDKFKTGVGLTFGQPSPGPAREFHCTYQQLLDEFQDKLGIGHGVVGKKIVKDLFSGKLLYICLPPTGTAAVKITKEDDAVFIERRAREVLRESVQAAADDVSDGAEETWE